MANQWQLYEVDPPTKWQAGTVGADHVPFYFDCAGCDAKEPAIAGMIGTGPTFSQVAIIPPADGSGFPVKAALYCAPCWPAVKSGEKLPRKAAVLGVTS